MSLTSILRRCRGERIRRGHSRCEDLPIDQVDIIKAAENFHGLLLKLRTVLFQIVSDNYKYKPLLSSINRLCSFWQKRVSNLTASIPSQLQDLNLQLNTMAYSVEADDEEPAKKTAKVNKKNDRKGIQVKIDFE